MSHEGIDLAFNSSDWPEKAERTDVRANLSIGTLDEDVWRISEPGTPPPARRVEAVARLNAAGGDNLFILICV